MDFWVVIKQATPLIFQGLKLTIIISGISIFWGMLVGLNVCFMKRSNVRVLQYLADVYVWVIRGTPMLIQALFFFFGVNQVISVLFQEYRLSVFGASVLTVTLNCGAYFSEIFRSGIISVPKGQIEAA